jgi:hypothetical protein
VFQSSLKPRIINCSVCVNPYKPPGRKATGTTKKLYKKNFDKKEAWPNYVAFLEPAYKFSPVENRIEEKNRNSRQGKYRT